jgi:hypothetical protein
MAIQVSDDLMALEVNGAITTTARFSQDAAADGNRAWIVTDHTKVLTRPTSQTLFGVPGRRPGIAKKRHKPSLARPAPSGMTGGAESGDRPTFVANI